MKDFVSTVIVTIALIALVSFFDIRSTTEQTGNGYGMNRKGDSGLIISGDGELLANANINPESIPEPAVGDKEESTDGATDDKMEDVATSEETKKEQNKMDGLIIAFWHGVAAVLIGEISALMVAFVWMKIRGGNDGK